MSPALRLLIYSPPEIAQAEIHDGINVEGEVLIGPRPTSQRAHQSCFNVRVLVQLTVLCQQGHPEVISRSAGSAGYQHRIRSHTGSAIKEPALALPVYFDNEVNSSALRMIEERKWI